MGTVWGLACAVVPVHAIPAAETAQPLLLLWHERCYAGV